MAIAPYFPEYRPFAEAAGAIFQCVPPDAPNFQIDFPALEQCLTENTAAVIVNSPNNPSGTVYTEQTLRQLARNMAWLLKCIEAGRAAGVPMPGEEPRMRTNFIR